MAIRPAPILAALLSIALCACGKTGEGAVKISVIGSDTALRENPPRLTSAAQLVRAASVEGLVGFDAAGRVGPALADRWIVTEDGRSYIFRLRDGAWPDGSPITGETAAALLRKVLAGLRGTALALDLSEVEEVRAMAGRVIEIRLRSPVPDLLTLLAQPELGLSYAQRRTGPMIVEHEGQVYAFTLIPPEQRGLPSEPGFANRVRSLRVRFEGPSAAVQRFNDGQSDIVLGGRIDSLPLAGSSGLIRGNVQIDPVIGLFGLGVENGNGFLADPANREALAMAIDRDSIIAAFNVSGWTPTTRIVSPDVIDDLGTVGERWTAMSLDERRASAAARVGRWSAGNGPVTLRVGILAGAGNALIARRLANDFRTIGVTIQLVGEGDRADLRLIDSVARYGRATWFLNQLSCGAGRPVCSEAADARAAEARLATDPQQRAALLAEAEAELTAANTFLPIARPLRWSLVRSDVPGFAPNPWGWHPLPPLALLPK